MQHDPSGLDETTLGEPALAIAGLRLWIARRDDAVPGRDDEDWLGVTVRAEAPQARVWVSGPIVMAEDLRGLRRDCEALLDGTVPRAVLAPLEPGLRVIIEPVDPVGHFDVVVAITPDHLRQSHEFRFDIDQTEIRALVAQLRRAVR